VGHEPRLLSHVGDLLAAHRGAAAAVECGQVDAADDHGSRVRQLEPGQQVQERRLPGSGRPGDGVQPAGVE